MTTLVIHSNIRKKLTGQTRNDGTKSLKTMEPLKCPSNFWRTLEIPLSNCEVNRILNWYNKIVLYPLMSGSLNSNIYND